MNITKQILLTDSVCRCCLAKNIELKPIFDDFTSIPQTIFLFTSVKIEENDNLPTKICNVCLRQLGTCINFKQKVESSAFELRRLLNSFKDQGSSGFSTDHDYAKPTPNALCETYENEKPSSSDIIKKTSIRKQHLFICKKCGKKFIDETTFKNHVECHIDNDNLILNSAKPMFICSICHDQFGAKEDLFVHSSLHDESNGFICKSCNKHFLTFFKLKRHVPSHFKEKPIKCKLCDMRFVEMASLTRHFRVHTGTKPKSIYSCSFCKKAYPNHYALKVHTRIHTNERPWKCDNCDKEFSDFRLLNSHKRVHDVSKPFQCKKCKKSFRHRSTLVTHLRIHTRKTPSYRCDKCRKTFKQSSRLKLHTQRTHRTVETLKFRCEQCCQMFTSKASLEDHSRWHSKKVEVHNEDAPKEAPPEFFHCNECSAQFSSRLDLITHQKLTHALRHECDTCFGKWKTLEELVRHKCNEALKASDQPSPDEMILLPNGQIQDCNTIIDSLLQSVSQLPKTPNEKETPKSS